MNPASDHRPENGGPDHPTGPGGGVAVISNPTSGGAATDDDLREAFAAAGVDATWLPTTEADPGLGQAAHAVEGGAHTVVACGGDGTVRAVLESLAGTDVLLGVVPLGTGNLLAGNLGLDAGLDAVPTAVGGTPKRLDVGVVNGERFAVMAGVGFDALMIRDANPALKRRIGSAAYVLSALRHLRSRVFGATVVVDGRRAWRGSTVMVLVGNCGSVSGGLEVFPDASEADGRLDVAVLSARGVRQWLTVGWRLVRKRPQPAALVKRWQGSEVVVHLDRAVPYELDGEVRPAASRLRFRVEPGALRVRVAEPPPADAPAVRASDDVGGSGR